MRLLGDYHTHTTYSHGKSSVRENVEEAIAKGLKTIAIAEHGPGHIFYGVSWDNLRKIKAEIEELRVEYKDQIEILFGLEANIIDFDGNLDISVEEAKELDFLACGYHNGIMPKGLKAKLLYTPIKKLAKVSKTFEKFLIKEATNSMIKATYKYDIKFLTHPGAKFYVDAKRLAVEKNKNTLLEINNKHGYLDVFQLKELENIDVKFIINSDAHKQSDVGNIEKALERLLSTNISIDRVVNLGK